jgi:hypothetical protein
VLGKLADPADKSLAFGLQSCFELLDARCECLALRVHGRFHRDQLLTIGAALVRNGRLELSDPGKERAALVLKVASSSLIRARNASRSR